MRLSKHLAGKTHALEHWFAVQWPARFLALVVPLAAAIVLALAVGVVRQRCQVHHLTIATTQRWGEYYKFGEALKTVVERHNPRIAVTVRTSNASLENFLLLERRTVELGLVQNNITPEVVADELHTDDPDMANRIREGDISVRAVTALFPGVFHLIASRKANIHSLSDLKGRRIDFLLSKKSGSYQLFLQIIRHYHLSENSFARIRVGRPLEATRQALADGEVDAVCHTMALGNEYFGGLLRSGQAVLVPIDQVPAMQISRPYLEPYTIPRGAYGGNPPAPARDVHTACVQTALMTHKDVDPRIIREVVRILYDYHFELVTQDPKSAMMRRSTSQDVPLHPGALAYYTQDEPGFVERNADVIALLLSVATLCASGVWHLRVRLQQRQKSRADRHNLQVLELIERTPATRSMEDLCELRQQLLRIFRDVVEDLDRDRISAGSLQFFALPWEVANSTIGHRELILMNGLADRCDDEVDGRANRVGRGASHGARERGDPVGAGTT